MTSREPHGPEWTDDELARIGQATGLRLASRHSDGTVDSSTIMWVVRVGDDLFVRSAGGPRRPWYRRALASGSGQIVAGGGERDVVFDQADPQAQAAIDRAYHDKYDRYGPGPVSHVTGPAAHPVTIRLARSAP